MVKVALWALESSGSGPKRVPGPSRTGRAPSESRRSNSPTDFLPRCRETLAFAGLVRGRPHHQALVVGPALRGGRGMVRTVVQGSRRQEQCQARRVAFWESALVIHQLLGTVHSSW